MAETKPEGNHECNPKVLLENEIDITYLDRETNVLANSFTTQSSYRESAKG